MTVNSRQSEPDLCANCGQLPGTQKWSNWPDGRMGVLWCEPCVLRKQIEHAEERAAALPGLRERLSRALDDSQGGTS